MSRHVDPADYDRFAAWLNRCSEAARPAIASSVVILHEVLRIHIGFALILTFLVVVVAQQVAINHFIDHPDRPEGGAA